LEILVVCKEWGNNVGRNTVQLTSHCIDLGDGLTKHGFYTTRFVEASNPDEAELKAVESLRQWNEIKSLLENEKNDPPMLYADEILELETFEGVNRDVEKGASWYKQEKNDHEDV
jgi:hypothetical protein